MTDDQFLDDLARRAFRFFFDAAHPHSGLVPDRARADGSKPGEMASVAATGFGLTALVIGAERGWESRAECRACAERVLRTLWRDAAHERGFFYHFLDVRAAQRGCVRAASWRGGCEGEARDGGPRHCGAGGGVVAWHCRDR